MRRTNNRMDALPTGQWLAEQRVRLSLTVGQLAKALSRHPSTIRAFERNNRVIPPGWGDELRMLGMQLPAPVWPSEMPFYFGADLKRDMNTCIGMRDSRYWLSKELCVPEQAVASILRDNLVVPQNWLLKLAELGANVPAVVRMALYQSAVDTASHLFESSPPDVSDGFSTPDDTAGPEEGASAARFSHESVNHNSGPDMRPAADDPSERRKQFISFQWSREEGLQLNLTTPMLEQIAAGLKELLLLYQEAMLKTKQRTVVQETAEPSHG